LLKKGERNMIKQSLCVAIIACAGLMPAVGARAAITDTLTSPPRFDVLAEANLAHPCLLDFASPALDTSTVPADGFEDALVTTWPAPEATPSPTMPSPQPKNASWLLAGPALEGLGIFGEDQRGTERIALSLPGGGAANVKRLPPSRRRSGIIPMIELSVPAVLLLVGSGLLVALIRRHI
jgi:hypothetical protein